MPLPLNPTVEITFEGLFLVLLDKPKTRCQMILPNPDGRHCLKIFGNVSGKKIELPRDFGGNLTLSVPGRTGVSLHKGTLPGDHDQDFDLIPDLEGPDFHGRGRPGNKHKLSLIRSNITQRISLDHGLLYTAKKLNVRLFREDAVTGMTDTGITLDVAHKIGCNFYLKEGEKAVLTLVGNSSLDLPFEPGVTQRLTISTHCETKDENHSDFIEYYKIVNRGLSEPRFDLKGSARNPTAMPPIKANIEDPCNPSRLSMTTIEELL